MKKIDVNNVASIREGIRSVCNRAATLQNDIQRVALACLHQTKEHANWSLARDLLEGITASKGVKSAKLTQWFEACMHATYMECPETGKMKFFYDDGKSCKDIDMAQAEAVKWFNFKAPTKDNSKNLEEIKTSVDKMFKNSIKNEKATEEQAKMIAELFDTLLAARDAE